jgi:predicted nucleotidyltransferase
VPKEWIGEEIVLIRRQKKKINERILDVLESYLDNIEGVFLYGSYARGEERSDSDIDLLVITNKKIEIKSEGFEIICLEKNSIEKALKIEPIIIHSAIDEAKAIVNSGLLEELREKYRPNLKEFEEFFEDSKRIIKINEKFIREEKDKIYLEDNAIVYSLVLRLRGLFIIKCLLEKKKYSYASLKKWVGKNLNDFDYIYDSYRKAKKDKNARIKIKTEEMIDLIKFLNKEIFNLNSGKKKKET